MHRRLLRVAIVASLALATMAYGALEKRVTVRVEGSPVAVRTFAFTVGDALQRAGVDLDPRDRVAPSLETRVTEGSTINVYRAKPITLLLDGKPRKVIVTSLTIDDVIQELRLRGTLQDIVRPSRASRVRAGMTITYRRAVAVTIVHDDKRERVITNAATVGAVISELGIKVGPQDKIRPSAKARPAAGMVIRVLRVGMRREVKEIQVAYDTILRRDRTLEYGRRKEVQEGRKGIRQIHYLAKYVDGRRVSRKLVKVAVVRTPRPRVIAIGTAFPGCACDRGVETGKGTWYAQADGLSAAHKTLPKGTVVRVENLANGKWVNVVIRDRGPYGKNRIIDLSDEAFRRLAPLSTGILNVRIRW